MIYDIAAETMPREHMTKLQGDRLKLTVERLYSNVPFYKQTFDRAGIKLNDISALSDLTALPFTIKTDLRDNYPFGLFAVPLSDIIRVHASSGTTGKRIVVGYTRNDSEIWAQVMARTFAGAGATKNDIVHVSYGYGLFTGGIGSHYGAEKLGATTVPVSVGNTKLQIQIMQDFGCTTLCCTPSYALYLAETMEEMGIDPTSLALKQGCFGAEPWTENMRKELETRLNLRAHDIYGLSEIIGPGVAFECEAQNGLHINEDHFVPEIIDPITNEPLPDGTYGELVFTCITKEALPLLRYRTHDIAMLNHEPCACGRTTVRMSKPTGRTDDMLIIRGINVFPSQIESVLLELGDTAPHYQLIVDRKGALDVLEVVVEMTESMLSDAVRHIEAKEQHIINAIQSTLGIAVQVRLVGPKTIERSEGKAVRVIDKRKIN